MKAKTILASITIAAVVLVPAAYLVAQSTSHPPAAPSAGTISSIKVGNDTFAAARDYIEGYAVAGQNSLYQLLRSVAAGDDRFVNEVDADTRRTPTSPPAGHIKCLITADPSAIADYLASLNGRNSRPLQSARYRRYEVGKDSALLGKRIRLSGWMKTKDVANWAGVSLAIINAEGHVFASDAMTDRPIYGTVDWKQIQIVTDVPSEPCALYFGPMLYGAGELWVDDFQFDAVPSNTPITDDRIWHVWSPNPNDYLMTTDPTNTHGGHPTLCITYTPAGLAPPGSWMWWGQDIRNPDQYRGHTVRMTVWIKTEKIGRIHPNLRPKGPNFQLLAKDSLVNAPPIRGTTDWTLRTILCEVPEGTQCLDTGFAFSGGGKLWIDMPSLKYEIADDERPSRTAQ